MDASFWLFLGVSIVVITTPGPDTALTIRNTLLGGRDGGIGTALGVATGQVVWVTATSAGLVAVLIASERVFLALKLAGAAYLIFLGIQALRAALRHAGAEANVIEERTPRRLSRRSAFLQGLISDLGNPKMAVFFASVLPQFATPGAGMFSELVALGLVFCALTVAWLAAYSVVIASAGDFFRRSRLRRWLEAVTGTVLIALGLRLAMEQR